MPNDDHVAELKKGVAAWNAWRREKLLREVDLSGSDLRNADLRGANLVAVDLSKASFFVADLRRANLRGAILRDAELAVANLDNTDLRAAKLEGADLDRASLVAANLGEAKLLRAKLSNANLTKADLREADLHEANLTKANLGGADLRGAQLRGANLTDADLGGADLRGAQLCGANLTHADLRGAIVTGADLRVANLTKADLRGAHLTQTNLSRADFSEADLTNADLRGADLKNATLVDTIFSGADLTGCHIHGISAWNLKLEEAKQQSLVITRAGEPEITVDNIEVAQFVYLLLHNEKIRAVIDTIGKKGVLLLGRFTEGRLQVLERLREKLRSLGFVPMVFNFDKPETKDFTETVRLLANLSHFVIVDITNPRSAPLELQATVPDTMVPFVPILEDGQDPFAMFVDLQNKYDWLLKPVIGYSSVDRLIEAVEDKIVRRAETKFNQLLERRNRELRVEIV